MLTTLQPYSIDDLPEFYRTAIKVHPVTGCWLWDRHRDRNGYGKYDGRNTHRLIWELLVGAVPPKLVLDHREDQGCTLLGGKPDKACGWPVHLKPVTNRENCTRSGMTGVGAINILKDVCGACGRPYDLLNTYWKPGGGRDCRWCVARRQREYKARLRDLELSTLPLAA